MNSSAKLYFLVLTLFLKHFKLFSALGKYSESIEVYQAIKPLEEFYHVTGLALAFFKAGKLPESFRGVPVTLTVYFFVSVCLSVWRYLSISLSVCGQSVCLSFSVPRVAFLYQFVCMISSLFLFISVRTSFWVGNRHCSKVAHSRCHGNAGLCFERLGWVQTNLVWEVNNYFTNFTMQLAPIRIILG